MRRNRRWWLVALLLVGACASPGTPSVDAGADMTASQCDSKTLFSDCSQHCGMHICVIASATCAGTSWTCDCASATVCTPDMAQRD